MEQERGNYYLVLSVCGFVYFILVFILYFANLFNFPTLILLLALTPLILVNINILFYSKQTTIFKVILVVISIVIFIIFISIILPYQPKFQPFNEYEFGILIFDNTADVKIDKKQIREKLENIKPDTTLSKKSIRIISQKRQQFFNDAELMNTFIWNQINKFNASIAILLQKSVKDSIYSNINIASKVLKNGFPKNYIQINKPNDLLPDALMKNVKFIFMFKKGVTGDEDRLEIITPQTEVEKVIASDQLYDEGTKTLKEVIDLPEDFSERSVKLEQALEKLRKSVRYDPTNDKSYAMMGYIKLEENDYDSAAVYYEKAREIQPKSHSHTLNLANNYYHADKRDRAIQVLREYLDNYGDYIEDDFVKLEMRKMLKDFERGE